LSSAAPIFRKVLALNPVSSIRAMTSLRLSLTCALLALGRTQEEEPARLASFLVLGDWGWDPDSHGDVRSRACQQVIADTMNAVMEELGDVKFVVNVGDSFYPMGVKDKADPKWNSMWRNVYSNRVRSVPWYSVYGNHDMIIDNGLCRGDDTASAQINYDLSDRNQFYMPGFSWRVEHPELDLEILALDLNHLWAHNTCRWSPCERECLARTKARQEAALVLFDERMAQSNSSNMVVFSHYPTDYLWAIPGMLGNLSNARRPNGATRHVEYFAGHRHNVDQTSTTSIHPNSNWVVGGGGGWGCDGKEQGFVVGQLLANGTLLTRSVLVDPFICCKDSPWGR